MALPKLNDQPKYELTIPSTQQKIRFRPFLVKEEKVLLLAMESKDETQILSSIIDTIQACAEGELNTSKLTTFDIEFMFTQLRSRSVGENVKLSLACGECEEPNEVSVPIDNIDVQGNMNSEGSIIELNSDISLQLQWPTYSNVVNESKALSGKSSSESTFDMIKMCIKTVITDEERIDFASESKVDQDNFINSMNTNDLNGIKDFMEDMPTLKHDVKFVCHSCNKDNEITLSGMQDFF